MFRKENNEGEGAFVLRAGGTSLTLLPSKAAFWEEEGVLFVADCHFGKVAHFRRAGIGIPGPAGDEGLIRLHRLVTELKAREILFLGDVFHSDYNADFDRFRLWRDSLPGVVFRLALGNHDLASRHRLNETGLEVASVWQRGPFHCTHEPDFPSARGFNLCGHLHPALSLTGTANQHVKVPAFWMGPGHLCFPSFGPFTGSVAISPRPEYVFFAVTGNRIRRVEGAVLC